MKITNIRWRKIAFDAYDRVLGECTIIIDRCLVINEIRVVIGKGRVFVQYPNRAYDPRNKNGAVYPINDELRRQWEYEILADFERAYMEFFQQ